MPPKIDQWVSVNDFSPGIRARTSPSASTSLRGDPLGIAKAVGTYRCQAMADKSLGPLMSRSNTYIIPPPTSTSGLFHNQIALAGTWVAGPIDISFEFHVAWCWRVGTTQQWEWHTYPFDLSADHNLGARSGAMGGLTALVDSIMAPPTHFNGHRSGPGTDPNVSGVPQTACAMHMNAGTGNSVWLLWPDAAAPTSYTPHSVASGYIPSIGLSHQGRHVIFDHHPHPHGSQSWNHNEDIYFTQPNLQLMESTQPLQIGLENCTGYSGAVSSSFTELFLIKSAGGGIVVRGDLADPTGVTALRVPAIPQVGTFHQIPAVTPVGVVFLTTGNGAWLWTGGENVEHISADAVDGWDFVLTPGVFNECQDFLGRMWAFQDYVLFPNNWVWNWKQQNWWRLEDPADVKFYWCGPDTNYYTRVMMSPSAVQYVPGGRTDTTFHEYDTDTPAKNYVWASQPLPILDERQFTIREVVFVVSGSCNWTFNLYDLNGVAETHTFTTTRTDRPVYIRQNCHVICQELSFDIYSTGATSAGNVFEVRFGIQQDTHYPLNAP